MTTTSAQRRALGAYGEGLAARRLVEAGMVLLDRNWRCSDGEIDLVLRDGLDLVVCEVKTRRSARFGTPHEAVTSTKRERLHRLGMRWADDHGIRPAGIRIDVVAVMCRPGEPVEFDHVRGLLG